MVLRSQQLPPAPAAPAPGQQQPLMPGQQGESSALLPAQQMPQSDSSAFVHHHPQPAYWQLPGGVIMPAPQQQHPQQRPQGQQQLGQQGQHAYPGVALGGGQGSAFRGVRLSGSERPPSTGGYLTVNMDNGHEVPPSPLQSYSG